MDKVIAESIASLLTEEVGLAFEPSDITLEWRHWRWFATLPGEKILFFTDDKEGTQKLAREYEILICVFFIPLAKNLPTSHLEPIKMKPVLNPHASVPRFII